MVLHLHEVAFPLPKNALSQVWLKWKKMIFEYYKCTCYNNYGPLFEQIVIPLEQGCFVPSLFEICPVAWRRIVYITCHLSSFLWKGCGPLFDQTWSPYNINFKWWFVPNLVEIGLMVLEKIERGVGMRQWRWTMNKMIRKAHLSLRLRWVNKWN